MATWLHLYNILSDDLMLPLERSARRCVVGTLIISNKRLPGNIVLIGIIFIWSILPCMEKLLMLIYPKSQKIKCGYQKWPLRFNCTFIRRSRGSLRPQGLRR